MASSLIKGILASLFFAFTFVFNRKMNLQGGYWGYSASLRYLFTLPILLLLLFPKGRYLMVLKEIKGKPLPWLLYSTIGFGLFYAPMSAASVYGESWFVAATWQITIVMGVLLTPLWGSKIPYKNLAWSFVILAGIMCMQTSYIKIGAGEGSLIALGLILIAAVSYPLGNRKMMEHCSTSLTTLDRVFGMTLCSMPFYIILFVYSACRVGLPSSGQLQQSFLVALFSGVIATLLFFDATNMVKSNPKQLAVIEATQAGEVIFTVLGGVIFLKDAMPSGLSLVGILVIVGGMIGNSLASGGANKKKK